MSDPDCELLGVLAARELFELNRTNHHDHPYRYDGEITREVALRLGMRGGHVYMKQGCTANGHPVTATVLGQAEDDGHDFALPVGRGTQRIVISLENAHMWTTKRPPMWS